MGFGRLIQRGLTGLIACLAVLLSSGCLQGPTPIADGPPPGLNPAPEHGDTGWRPVAYPVPRRPIARPAEDPFYQQPAWVRLAGWAPGTVIRYRRIAARRYRFGQVPARAWQFVYASRDQHDRPIADTATLLLPAEPADRLLSYQVAYDALNPICDPSQELLRGTLIEQHFVSMALARGWALVLPDHEGPRMAYLAGRQAGHAVLDGLRGADALMGPAPQTPIGLWGYSGGGFATLWAGQMAVDYAPELAIRGIAAGGVPADLEAVAERLDGHGLAGIYFQAFFGLAGAEPTIDLDTLLNPRGRAARDRLAHSCLGQWLSGVRDPLFSGLSFAELADYTRVDTPRALPAVQRLLAENRLGGERLVAPLYYYHGRHDPIVAHEQAEAVLATYCAQGTPVIYAPAWGEHILAALLRADEALDFLAARVAGRSALDDSCLELRRPG